MSRIAYLIGESGSGKGTLGKEVQNRRSVDLIKGDLVLMRTARFLPPLSPAGQEMDTGNWLTRAKQPDLRSAFRIAIETEYPDFASSAHPILAEATLFCLRPLLEAFHGAIRDLRPGIVEAKLYWLDITAEKLLSNIRIRNRPQDSGVDAAEIQKRLVFFAGQMALHGAVHRATCTATLTDIDAYLA